MIFVEDSHDHLETGLFLYGQNFLDAAYDNLEATGFQFLVGFTEDDIQLHMGSRSYTVDDKHHLVASLRLQLLTQQVYHFGRSSIGRYQRFLTATAFTSEDVMAATFNTEIMTEIGKVIGNNCLQANIACLYGPGNNIHRTPYGGRNFEYYSEDGFLSGMMSAYEVKAIQDKGVHVVMKHFALNDCEQDRIGLGVWLNEQAAREVYLKAFQAPVEVGNANGVMIAYTRWGAVWSGGNYGLVTGILRNEWGCEGMVITDNVLTQYVNGPDGVLAGVSIYDAMMSFVTDTLPQYKNDPVIVTAMREACHHNLYAIANCLW